MFEFSSNHHFVFYDVTTNIPIIINQSWYLFFWSSPKNIMQIIIQLWRAYKENFLDNQNLLQSVIISPILMNLMCDSEVML